MKDNLYTTYNLRQIEYILKFKFVILPL